MIERDRHTDLTKAAKGKVCIRCDEDIRVAWINGTYTHRCGCYPETPMMIKEFDRRTRRVGDMLAKENPEVGLAVGNHVAVQAQGPGLVAMPPATTIEEYEREQALVKHIMSQMEEGKDYGLIPGTQKKSLWEPGAEALRRAFRIVWQYRFKEELEDYDNMEFRYVVQAYQLLNEAGLEGIGWEATAWSKEKKFNGMEREMLSHNVKDRAIKRAFVALIRNIAGASGEFDPDSDVAPNGDSNQVICSVHNVPFEFAEGKFGPYYRHSSPKHNVNENKIKEFTMALEDEPEEMTDAEQDNV
jgi:hypothetical protein